MEFGQAFRRQSSQLIYVFLLCSACGDSNGPLDASGDRTDASADASADTSTDASVDVFADASIDAFELSDTGVDALDVVDASSDASSDGGVDAGPCVGVVCEEPPVPECVGSALRTYAASGMCVEGVCDYPFVDTGCPFGCESNACVPDPCRDVTCESPPDPVCMGDILRSYAAVGSCSDGSCSYAHVDTTCAAGCTEGACVDDPCGGVVCMSPPASVCADASTLRTYASSGSCVDEACRYGHVDTSCVFGCDEGACAPDPCADVVCTAPPAPACTDADTLRTHAASGTCHDGDCSYEHVDTTCPFGCEGGACAPDPCIGVVCSPLNICQEPGRCVGGTCEYASVSGCTYEEVGLSTWVSGTSMALDDSNEPHIAYYDMAASRLRYVRHELGVWNDEEVAIVNSDSFGRSSIAFDGAQRPHILYYNALERALGATLRSEARMARRDSTWTTWRIAGGGLSDLWGVSSLALLFDGDDLSRWLLSYSFRDTTPPSATDIGVRSTAPFPDGGYDHLLNGSFAIGETGNIHVVYRTVGPANLLRHAMYDGTSWTAETVDIGTTAGTSIVLGPSDVVHIAYGRGVDGELAYATNAGGSWAITPIDTVAGTGMTGHGLFTSIDLDSDGHPHIASAVGTLQLRYAHFDGSSWTRELADRTGSPGVYPTLIVDDLDRVHLSFVRTRGNRSVIYIQLP